ncbi:hypothetical protein AB3Y40_13015 [Yoonia sp. R2331]|uniref:CBU_0592 family membrane protein n=1 Tax=Yoonia sp. R2331 TaxID=3237238 RepID=UPI0034E5BAD3
MDIGFGSISHEVYDAIGVAGFALYVLNYGLLTVQRNWAAHVSYFVINWFAASLVLIGLMASFNLASAMIQIFWIVISTIGIIIRLRRRRTPEFSSLRNRGFTPS